MMKKFIAALLCSALLLSGCSATEPGNNQQADSTTTVESTTEATVEATVETTGEGSPTTNPSEPEFSDVSSPDFLQYVEDSVFASTEGELSSDDYVVESVAASHVSKEYLEELEYNSQENIYFGHRLSEIEEQFEGEKYVFALGDNGETEVRSLEAYDDTFDRVLKNVAVGSGVILIAVTVSLVAAPAAPAVSVIFAASAKTGALGAFSGAGFGGLIGGVVTAYETGDATAALKNAALGASEGFKWGAVTGAVAGGASKLREIRKPNLSQPTYVQSEQDALAKYGGVKEKSYVAGKEVPYATPASTRPDIVRERMFGRIEAIEVKNYDLVNNLSPLRSKLRSQVSQRVQDLPPGSRQRIVLDVRGRNYSDQFIKEAVEDLKASLKDIDPKVIIDVMRS